MNPLDDFIKAQIQDVQRQPQAGPGVTSNSLTVNKVAPVSPAGQLGLRPADLLESVENTPAAKVDFDVLRPPREGVTYRFYLPQRSESLVLKATCCPLGATFRADNATLSQLFRAGTADLDALVQLWEGHAWDHLREAVAPWAQEQKPGFFGRLLGKKGGEPETSPMTLMDGAALWELGDHEAGMKKVLAYRVEEGRWTTDYFSIARYYQGKDLERRGQRQQAVELLRDAFEHCQFDDVADALARLTGQRPHQEKPWSHEQFPLDYDLQDLLGQGRVSLRAQLNGMQPHQLFVVCLLANYRGNGPYNDFMRRYHRLALSMRPCVAGLHVITMEPERRADRPHWYEAEDDARAAAVPFAVLLDEEGEVTFALEPDGSPFLLLLSKSGHIVRTGDFDDVELGNRWSGLLDRELLSSNHSFAERDKFLQPVRGRVSLASVGIILSPAQHSLPLRSGSGAFHMMAIQCPECGKRYAVREQAKGKKVTCQACRVPFVAVQESDEDGYGIAPPELPAAKREAGVKRPAPKPAPGGPGLTDLLDDKILGDFPGQSNHEDTEDNDPPEKPKRLMRKPEAPTAGELSDNRKAVGMIVLSLFLVGLIGWGIAWVGPLRTPKAKPSGPPVFTLSGGETLRDGNHMLAAVRYSTKQGLLTPGQRLFWVLQAGEASFERDVTDQLSNRYVCEGEGTLGGKAFENHRGEIPDILSMHIELEAYDGHADPHFQRDFEQVRAEFIATAMNGGEISRREDSVASLRARDLRPRANTPPRGSYPILPILSSRDLLQVECVISHNKSVLLQVEK